MRKSFVVVIVFLALFTVTAYLNAQNAPSGDHAVVVELDNNACTWEYDIYAASGSLAKSSGLDSDAVAWSITCHGLITLPEDIDIQETQRIISNNENSLGTCLVKPFNFVTNEWQLLFTSKEKSQIICSGSKNPYPYPPQETPDATSIPAPCGYPYPYPSGMEPPVTPTADAYPYPYPVPGTPDPCGQPEPTAPPPPATATSDSYPYPSAPTITPSPTPSPTPLPTSTPVVYP